jgi:uncharacterized protein (DUF1501 family)
MAYRMQMSVPELTDFSDESEATLEMYGPDVRKPGSFAANCLMARRLAERDVRFIQLYMRGWDQHNNLPGELRQQCNAVDRAQAALVTDLKQRGLLDETLVLWGGEFGRTPTVELPQKGANEGTISGRDHNHYGFSVWLAGGGVRGGQAYGATDDFGFKSVENRVHVHDLHATMLRLMGFDHTQLTYRYAGRDFRLTDVHGRVIPDWIA